MADELARYRLPVVNVSSITLPECGFPRVTSDYDAVAALAVGHMADRGYRNFAYVGPMRFGYARTLAEAFQAKAATRDARVSLFDYPQLSGLSRGWAEWRRRLGGWLASLDKPVGIFCWAATSGTHVLDACRVRGLRVPDDVAVLGGDDDPLICNTTSPPMSAVLTASEQIGFLAATRLDRLMRGRRDDGRPQLIEPVQVTVRQSTDAIAIEDPDLRQAVIFIRAHAYEPIGVEDVAAAAAVSRRMLERKFRDTLDRSPLEEIRRHRLARARELLATSDLAVSAVAAAAGFGTPEYLTAVFKSEFGTTPLRYRSGVRARR
jgi:LacI family transcriptional regulator